LIVFSVSADPKPDNQIAATTSQSAIVLIHPDGPDISNQGFEMQRNIESILLPKDGIFPVPAVEFLPAKNCSQPKNPRVPGKSRQV